MPQLFIYFLSLLLWRDGWCRLWAQERRMSGWNAGSGETVPGPEGEVSKAWVVLVHSTVMKYGWKWVPVTSHDIRLFRERLNQVKVKLDEVLTGKAGEYREPLAALQNNMQIRTQVAGSADGDLTRFSETKSNISMFMIQKWHLTSNLSLPLKVTQNKLTKCDHLIDFGQ